ncbi:DUF1642 domain-containing protein [Streptococcus dysgalactiae]|uniref:DUF1642 domain-containing protein n=1 Tax=Streptococcus dysgalactiae TaxID=1334 RepID=UPI000E06B000|nr:DUF1642 domain-containing protein [Streptococcus dysgalactiae]QQT02879.1 DUF1642 domain-containing protein [Streptococcus dysgalactiae]SUN44643.1 phage protein [Streptococcus dysgalactiae subsp. dysgalactiae]SUN49120.1 phage protein [Streptococcus dysgalactiae]SUN54831.1 phage protein [Streptococcus dysgalactiae]
MNIEEAIEYIEEAIKYFEDKRKDYIVPPSVIHVSTAEVINILKQIKFDKLMPEIPQFVADWYEEHKDNLEYNLYLYQMTIYDEKVEKDDFYYWIQKSNSPIRTLINMHQFGYTVEKEKLYTVEIPNPNDKQIALRLEKWVEGKVRIVTTHSSNNFTDDMRLTEQEIRKDFDWAFRWAEEVTE